MGLDVFFRLDHPFSYIMNFKMKDFLNVKPGKQQVCNSIKLELRFSLVVEAKVLAKKPGNNQFGQEVKYIVEVLKDYKV